MKDYYKTALREVVREVLDGLLEDDEFIEFLRERLKSSPVPALALGLAVCLMEIPGLC